MWDSAYLSERLTAIDLLQCPSLRASNWMRVPGSNGKANAATLPHMNEPDEVALPDSAEAASAADPSRPVFIFDTRLNFLYHVVEDTQNTIRFLDTKAAFCVTLLSGMTAVALQHPQSSRGAHVLLGFFLAVVVVAVLVNLRVIFPVIRASHPTATAPVEPKFYIGHNKAHHWLLHTVANPVDDVLSETHSGYVNKVAHATDTDLVVSMSDTVLKLALIRQVKSDRLHAAMFCLMAAVLLFAAVVLA